MKNTNKLLALLLSVAMLLSMIPISVFASTETVVDFVSAPAGAENLALSADVTASDDALSGGAEPVRIKDGDRTWSMARNASSLDNAVDYYQFTWQTPVAMDEVVLFNQHSGQAPTAWNVFVSSNGNDWSEVASASGVTWSESNLDGKGLSFAHQNNVVGLKIQITDANLDWGHYCIYEIEVYNSGDADDNAVIAENFVSVPDGIENSALTALVTASDDALSGGAEPVRIKDGDRTWSMARNASSLDNAVDYYQFAWQTPISVNQVVLFNQYSGQAPTAWTVFVTTDGTNWNKVAVTEDVSWSESDLQGKVLKFKTQEDILGLRVQIINANLDWKHYCIYEIEIYDTSVIDKDGYEIFWNDEFNGSELNSEKWLNQYLPHATTSENGAMADYEMSNGVLTLKIDENHPTYYDVEGGKGFKVSSIQTYEKNWLHDVGARKVEAFDGFKTQYGYFETRYKMPSCGGGGHVAFWMVGTQADARVDGRGALQNSEIDITETKFSSPNKYTPRIYGQDDPDMVNWSAEVDLDGDCVNQWHTYAVDWTPDYIAFIVDGAEVARSEQSPQYEMCLLLGMYINDDPNDKYWDGVANDTYPKEWEIDYVRVYKSKHGYSAGKTKPASPELLDGSVAVTDSVVVSGMENIAPDANVIASGSVVLSNSEELAHINNENRNDSLTRLATDLNGKTDFYQFEWENPVTVNQVVVYNQYVGQAPVAWEVFVTTDGNQWSKVAVTDNVLWSDDQLEGKALTFARQKDIIGLRLQIRKANLDWEHYCIYEVEIYDTHQAIEFPNLYEKCNPGFDGALDDNRMPELWTAQGNGECGSYDNWGDMISYLWKPVGAQSFGMRSSKIPVVPGELYYTEMLVSGIGTACFYVEYWNADGEQSDTYYVTTKSLNEDSWQSVGGNFVAPSDAAYMGIQIRSEGTEEETVRFDDLYACVNTENYTINTLKRAITDNNSDWVKQILTNPPCAFNNVNDDAWDSYYAALRETPEDTLSFDVVQQVIDSVNESTPAIEVIMGDANINGVVDILDIVRLKKLIAGLYGTPTEAVMKRVDFDKSNVLDAFDLSSLKTIILSAL